MRSTYAPCSRDTRAHKTAALPAMHHAPWPVRSMTAGRGCLAPSPAPGDAVAVLFLGDRVVPPRSADAALQRLCSAAGACAAVQARLPRGTRVLPVPPSRYVAGGLACFDAAAHVWRSS